MDPNYVPRSAADVLKQILVIIPETETILLNELNKYKQDLSYKPPELLEASDCWTPFIEILNYFIPNKDGEWQIKIRDILENKKLN